MTTTPEALAQLDTAIAEAERWLDAEDLHYHRAYLAQLDADRAFDDFLESSNPGDVEVAAHFWMV